MNKKELREKYKKLRKNICQKDIDTFSLEIANKALELSIWNFSTYHIFLPISEQKEINTEFLLHILQGRDKSIVIPKVISKTEGMIHLLLQDNTSLKLSNYGVPEPVSGIEIKPQDIQVVFVPLLAYDKRGNRVGYGKGFYDRFLAQCKEKTIFIGLSFFQAETSLDYHNNDIPLHYCVTPNKTYTFNN